MVGVKVNVDHDDVIRNPDVTSSRHAVQLWGQYHGTLSPINEMMAIKVNGQFAEILHWRK